MRNLMAYLESARGMNRNAHLFLAHTLLSGSSIALLALLYNLYITSLGYKQDMIGTVTLVACTVGVVAALPAGYALNRLGYKRALIVAVLLTGFSMVLPLMFPVSAVLIGCELFWGIGFTLLIIAGAPFMTENSTETQRAPLFSLQFVLTMLTAFVGNLVGGALPRWFGGWLGAGAESAQAYQGALYVGAALMFLSAVPFIFVRQNRPDKNAHPARPRLRIEHPVAVTKLLAPYIIGGVGAGMFVPFANVLWKTTQNVSDATIGSIFALSALVMVGAGMFAPMLSQRFGQVRVMVVFQSAAVIGLFAFGAAPFLGIALLGYLTRDVLTNLVRPIFGQFMMDHSAPAERAAVSALATMGFNFAWGVSSWVSGVWQSENQLLWVYVASAGFSVLAIGAMQYFFGGAAARRAVQTAKRPLGSPAE
ncbi:MAG: MFS transporter [Chloroflexi bacterium]|nr:MFS transporter [Chloroflexota bacterium]